MNIVTVAPSPIWKDPQANIAATAQQVAEVMRLHPKTQLILFPEISLMGGVVDDSLAAIAEELDGYCVTEIKKLAALYPIARAQAVRSGSGARDI